jgi:enoyl-CoA hydratase
MVIFGERVDGPRAAELGLAWRCVDDDALLDDAVALAERAAEAPRELMAAVKSTLHQAPWHTDFDGAVAMELNRQTWSFGQGWFGR